MYQSSQIKISGGDEYTVLIDLKKLIWTCGGNIFDQFLARLLARLLARQRETKRGTKRGTKYETMKLNDTNNRLTLTSMVLKSITSIASIACGKVILWFLTPMEIYDKVDKVSLRAGLSGLWGCSDNRSGQFLARNK